MADQPPKVDSAMEKAPSKCCSSVLLLKTLLKTCEGASGPCAKGSWGSVDCLQCRKEFTVQQGWQH